MENKNKYPKISIITPSFNQGSYIEKTILSVINQGYENLEYIIIDGGSTDNTVSIIENYKDSLAYWISEHDRGQSEAINKGLSRATGDIVAWLNSDDWYSPDTLAMVAEAWNNGGFDVLHGDAEFFYEGEEHRNYRTYYGSNCSQDRLLKYWSSTEHCNPPQPSVFIKRSVFMEVGGVNEDYHLAMDYHLWLKIAAAGHFFRYLPEVLAYYRFHNTSKSGILADFKHFHSEWHRVFLENTDRFGLVKKFYYSWLYAGFYYDYRRKKLPQRIFSTLRGGIKTSKFK